jgi:hypothetical protein
LIHEWLHNGGNQSRTSNAWSLTTLGCRIPLVHTVIVDVEA